MQATFRFVGADMAGQLLLWLAILLYLCIAVTSAIIYYARCVISPATHTVRAALELTGAPPSILSGS